MSILKLLTKGRSIKLYRSILDLPIWNWDQVKKTEDRRYLIKLKDYDELPKIEVPADLWNDLLKQYKEDFEEQGTAGYVFEKFVESQILLRDEVIMSCDEYNPNLSSTIVRRKQAEKELENMPTGGKQTLEDQAVVLEIFFKMSFDTRKTSTYRWYKYIQEYERRIEELNRQQSKGTKKN